jgi:hypothetical protein
MTGPCTKTRYRDHLGAKLALMRIQRKDKTMRPKQERRAYRCPDCKGWHLTSQGARA